MDACGVPSATRGVASAAVAAFLLIVPPVLFGQQTSSRVQNRRRRSKRIDAVTDANGRFVRNLTRDDFWSTKTGATKHPFFQQRAGAGQSRLALDTSGSWPERRSGPRKARSAASW